MYLSQILKVFSVIFTLESWGVSIEKRARDEQEMVVIEGVGSEEGGVAQD